MTDLSRANSLDIAQITRERSGHSSGPWEHPAPPRKTSGLSIVNAALIVLIGLMAGAVVSKGIGNLAHFNVNYEGKL